MPEKKINGHAILPLCISYLYSPWMCGIFFSTLYVIFSLMTHPNIFHSTNFAYYSLLADAFLHGRTDIYPQGNVFDLSFFKEKWYLYWGASPVLFVFPFFLIGSGAESDIFTTLIAGILNIFIFTCVLKEFLKYTGHTLTPFFWWISVGSFAIASPNFFLSIGGHIWHTGQIISMLYLLIFLWFFFRFLNTKKILLLLPMLLFFNLAWLGRLPLIFYGILFLYLLKKEYGIQKTHMALLICAGIALGGIFFGWYNNERFGSPIETGARFQLGHARYRTDTKSGTFLSLKNVPHNVRYYFIESPFSFHPPALSFSPEGTSIFFVYPVTIFFLFSLFKKKKSRFLREFLPYAYAVLLLLMTFLLLFLGTGWYQFGSRYFFDLIPLVFLCAVPLIKTSPRYVLTALLFYEVLIHISGVLVFYAR